MSFHSNSIHAAIYGGPLPRQELAEHLREAGLDFPVFVAATNDRIKRIYHRAWAFHPGDGLIYLTASQPRPEYADRWHWATDLQSWRGMMQQAIITLRQEALGRSKKRPDREDEARMRRLARHRFLAGEQAWREAVIYWCSLVFSRTSRKIHDAQLAFVGFLVDASGELTTIGNAGYRFHHVLQELLHNFSTPALERLFFQGLEILEEELARNRTEDDRVRKALRFLRLRAHEHLTLPEVAWEAGMHPTAFSRKLRNDLGQTFTQYLQSIRLERAIELLITTRRTVLDIALESGFGSAEQFHRVFKRRFESTPHAYRRRHRGGSSKHALPPATPSLPSLTNFAYPFSIGS